MKRYAGAEQSGHPTLKQFGKKRCPSCGTMNRTAWLTCRKCGYRYTTEENREQVAFEARLRKRTAIICAAMLIPVAGLAAFADKYSVADPAARSTQLAAWPAGSELLARATAGAALKERMSNPSSFDLVEAVANHGRADDGSNAWIVGVTYRGTNAFGGIVTNHAIVTVDKTGQAPLGIVDVN